MFSLEFTCNDFIFNCRNMQIKLYSCVKLNHSFCLCVSYFSFSNRLRILPHVKMLNVHTVCLVRYNNICKPLANPLSHSVGWHLTGETCYLLYYSHSSLGNRASSQMRECHFYPWRKGTILWDLLESLSASGTLTHWDKSCWLHTNPTRASDSVPTAIGWQQPMQTYLRTHR